MTPSNDFWRRLGNLGRRIVGASDLDRGDVERVALTLLAAGGDEADVALVFEDFYEDAINFQVLLASFNNPVLSALGVGLEAVDDLWNAWLARRSARAIIKVWGRLSQDEQIAWVKDTAGQVA
ncbi:MAG: hypothetical protein AAFV53_38865 [Myxococcota bacterium]